MLEIVTMKEIEAIFEITDRLGLSREWIEIPLGPESPGKVRKLPGGKFEIVVDEEVPLVDWLKTMEKDLKSLMGNGP